MGFQGLLKCYNRVLLNWVPLALKGKETWQNHSTSQPLSITHLVNCILVQHTQRSLWRLGALQTHDELRCFLPDWSWWARSKDPAESRRSWDHAQAYVDGMAVGGKNSSNYSISSYDKFIRTTDDYHHEKWWPQVFERLLAQDDIYLGGVPGWYSVSDEESLQKANLAEVFRDENGKGHRWG